MGEITDEAFKLIRKYGDARSAADVLDTALNGPENMRLQRLSPAQRARLSAILDKLRDIAGPLAV